MGLWPLPPALNEPELFVPPAYCPAGRGPLGCLAGCRCLHPDGRSCMLLRRVRPADSPAYSYISALLLCYSSMPSSRLLSCLSGQHPATDLRFDTGVSQRDRNKTKEWPVPNGKRNRKVETKHRSKSSVRDCDVLCSSSSLPIRSNASAAYQERQEEDERAREKEANS